MARRHLKHAPISGPRLVVVSNRVADPRQPAAGGLAVALGDALRKSGGLWFGWSGTVVEQDGPSCHEPLLERAGSTQLATIDLSREDHEQYYLGFSNRVLWPVFHYRLDLAVFESAFTQGYRRVNRRMAEALRPLLRDDDVIWVHDYHLIPLANELRELGCRQRMGFFLHIPLPPPQILAAIPAHEWLMRSLFSYDLVGMHTHTDVMHLSRYTITEAKGEVSPDETTFHAYGRTTQVGAFPIGIDVASIEHMAGEPESRRMFAEMRSQYRRRSLVVGVDRLDYSKGLTHRVRAFRDMLNRYPDTHSCATLIQIAPPSREDVAAYADIRRELEALCGAINGDYGELDWMPVRYLARTVARERLPGLYRAARVGMVTPLRDGMNLVAKEYVASQDPEDPGVLVLSRFAGAAEELEEALCVNPYDLQGTADALHRALNMSLSERQQRHAALLKRLREHDVHWWRSKFLETLSLSPLVRD